LTGGTGNHADYDRAAGGHRLGLESRWKDLPRTALESLALEAYRSRALTAAQLGRLLVFETRMQVDAFLKEHEIFDYSAADFEQDRETLRELRMREARP
jgi:Uncharacterised protein family (UPF0175)